MLPAPFSPLKVVEQIRRMRGGAQSHLMRCSDENYYIVKFKNNPQGIRVLVNEFLGTRLAALLGLPTTPIAIVYVDEDLIRLTTELRMELTIHYLPCRPGLQFGSRYPLNPQRVTVLDFLPDKQLSAVGNLRDFVGMAVFDIWTSNLDGRQTIFYRPEVGGPYTTEMIDQGFCFGGIEWNFLCAPRRVLYARKAVYESVRDIEDFEPWLTKLETEINGQMLIEIAKDIPPEWYESDSASLERLLEQLDLRRSKVRKLLLSTCESSSHLFTNWNSRVVIQNPTPACSETEAILASNP
jgi:HipA-like protein